MQSTINDISKTLVRHVSTVSPGLPIVIGEAANVGDFVHQGDLIIYVSDKVPHDYVLVENPQDIDRQLVPLGGGPGSHHRLKSLDGVTIYRPNDWGKSDTDLRGPCIVFDKPNQIVHEPGTSHPHGTVDILVPMVTCRYQRNLSDDERAARRAAD